MMSPIGVNMLALRAQGWIPSDRSSIENFDCQVSPAA